MTYWVYQKQSVVEITWWHYRFVVSLTCFGHLMLYRTRNGTNAHMKWWLTNEQSFIFASMLFHHNMVIAVMWLLQDEHFFRGNLDGRVLYITMAETNHNPQMTSTNQCTRHASRRVRESFSVCVSRLSCTWSPNNPVLCVYEELVTFEGRMREVRPRIHVLYHACQSFCS